MGKKKCGCKTGICNPIIIQGLPGFPGTPGSGGGGDGGALQNLILQVATGYSSDPLEDYQFLVIQEAIDYAISQSPTAIGNPFTIYIAPGSYTENLTIPSNVHLVGSSYSTSIIFGNVDVEMSDLGFSSIENIFIIGDLSVNINVSATTFFLENSKINDDFNFSFTSLGITDSEISIDDSILNNLIETPVSLTPNPSINIKDSMISSFTISTVVADVKNSEFTIINASNTSTVNLFSTKVSTTNFTGTSILRASECKIFSINGGSGTPIIIANECDLSDVAVNGTANLLGSTFSILSGTGGIDRTQTFRITTSSASFVFAFNSMPSLVNPYIDTNYQVLLTQTSGVATPFTVTIKTIAGFTVNGVSGATYDAIVTRQTSTIV